MQALRDRIVKNILSANYLQPIFVPVLYTITYQERWRVMAQWYLDNLFKRCLKKVPIPSHASGNR